MYKQGRNSIICSNHPIAKNEYCMKECQVTIPNKLEPEKTLKEDYLICPRCFQTIRLSSDLKKILDAYKNGTTKEISTGDSQGIDKLKHIQDLLSPAF